MTDNKIITLRKRLMEQEFSNMNPMQLQAVFCTDGPLLLLAGAGSGKTTVLVNRIANIISYGDAYNSLIVPTLSQKELAELEDSVESRNPVSTELKSKLAVDPAKPWQILAITFTNKAAGELKERICARVENGGDGIFAATFHSTCARILRMFGDRLGYTDRFTVYDTDDSRRLMKDVLKTLNIDEKLLPHKSVLNEISRLKDKMVMPDAYAKAVTGDFRQPMTAKAYALYQERLKSSDAMDFDDLLLSTVRLFKEHPDVLDYYHRKFKYILVDEYQDTNRVQYEFVRLLAEKSNNICVVGDDDQSIYKFRGATIENILSFENTFPNSKVIRLEQNYRSTKCILDAANSVIDKNLKRKGKTLWTENETGEKIELHTAFSEREEADFIMTKIMDGVSKGRKYSDFAVLYRMNAQSRTVEMTLTRAGIPHRIVGGVRFLDREEVKDMTSYLHVINNPHDDIRLKRIINKPRRGIGDTTLAAASEIAAMEGISIFDVISSADQYRAFDRSLGKLRSFCELINGLREYLEDETTSLEGLYAELLERTGYLEFLQEEKEKAEIKTENVMELKSNIMMFEQDYGDDAELSSFLEEISLESDIDNYNGSEESVTLMTLHSAKGLEFPVVFIPGMEDGIFPGITSIQAGAEEIEEERRLAYVGITRAKQKLYLVRTQERLLYGMTKINKPSRFALEIPEELIEKTGAERREFTGYSSPAFGSERGYKSPSFAANPQPSGGKFAPGDSVKSKVFGVGMILSAEKMGNDTLLEIAFEKVGTKKLMSNFAKLEKA